MREETQEACRLLRHRDGKPAELRNNSNSAHVLISSIWWAPRVGRMCLWGLQRSSVHSTTNQARRSEQKAAEPGVRQSGVGSQLNFNTEFYQRQIESEAKSKGIVWFHSLALGGEGAVTDIYKSAIHRFCPKLCLGPVVWLGKPFLPLLKMTSNPWGKVLPERLCRPLSPWTRHGRLVL